MILKAIEYDEAVVFQMIVDLSKHFQMDSTEFISKQIQKISQKVCNINMINLVVEFSINTRLNMAKQ